MARGWKKRNREDEEEDEEQDEEQGEEQRRTRRGGSEREWCAATEMPGCLFHEHGFPWCWVSGGETVVAWKLRMCLKRVSRRNAVRNAGKMGVERVRALQERSVYGMVKDEKENMLQLGLKLYWLCIIL